MFGMVIALFTNKLRNYLGLFEFLCNELISLMFLAPLHRTLLFGDGSRWEHVETYVHPPLNPLPSREGKSS